jgi:hypothetical protein
VTICAGRLAGAGSNIERNGEKLERPMSSSKLYWADDDDVYELICISDPNLISTLVFYTFDTVRLTARHAILSSILALMSLK